MDILKTDDYQLTPISKERFKIEVVAFKFRNIHSATIQGCYFSGPQQSWVTVCVKKDVPQFDLFFCSKKQTQFCSSF